MSADTWQASGHDDAIWPPAGFVGEGHTADRGQRAMSGAVPPAGPAGAVPGRPAWPIRSGAVTPLAKGFSARPETAPDLAAALAAGAAVALIPDRATPAAQDWLRSSGKTQLAAAFAESLWHSGGVDLLETAASYNTRFALPGEDDVELDDVINPPEWLIGSFANLNGQAADPFQIPPGTASGQEVPPN